MNTITILVEQAREAYEQKPLAVLFTLLGIAIILWLILAGTRKEKK